MRSALVFAELSDLLTFICAMSVLPISAEANPVARASYALAGTFGVVALKSVGTGVLLLLVPRSPRPRLFGSIAIGLAVVGAILNTVAVTIS